MANEIWHFQMLFLHVNRHHQPSLHEHQLEQCTLKTVNELTSGQTTFYTLP